MNDERVFSGNRLIQHLETENEEISALWKKTGRNKESIKKLIRVAYEALNEVTE